jgi:microcystin degradation protein MlrC
VVVADGADNPGGGAPGDATYVLRAALEAGLDNAAFGMFWDPHAVRLAADAGEGERLTVRLGGKTCALSGVPLDLDVVVRRVVPNVVQHFAGLDWHAGQTVLLEAGPLQVVATERRVQTFLPDVFTGLGVDLSAKRLVAVKSAQHFYAAFAPLAASVIYVDAPGVLVNDLSQLPFRHADTTQWPFDPALTLV